MTPHVFPVRFESPSGLCVQVNANGSIRRLDHRDVILNLFLGNRDRGRARERLSAAARRPRSSGCRCSGREARRPSTWTSTGSPFAASGTTSRFTSRSSLARVGARVVLARRAREQRRGSRCVVDLVYAQDLALAPYGAVRMNEYYVSQYVDHTPLAHAARGTVLAVRQNLAMGGRNPWAVIGSLGRAVELRDRRARSSTAWRRARASSPPALARRRCRGGAGSTSTRWR